MPNKCSCFSEFKNYNSFTNSVSLPYFGFGAAILRTRSETYLLVLRRCQQIKAKYRANFQDPSNDHEDDDSGSDLEADSEEEEEVASDKEKSTEDDEKHGWGGSDDPVLTNAPDGVEAYQKASAWYQVAYSDETNPFLAEARKAWDGCSQGTRSKRDGGGQRGGRGEEGRGFDEPHMLYLSFPWICAHEQLCQIKEMRLTHKTSEPP